MTHHDLARVRMNPTDHSLHCDVHGLLTGDEEADVYHRAGIYSDQVEAGGWQDRLARLIDPILSRLMRRDCVADA